MNIMKFGGTSVGNSENIRRVTTLIDTPEPKVVIVSAMAGTTNQLVEVSSLHASGFYHAALNILHNINQRYMQTANELLQTAQSVTAYARFLNTALGHIESLIGQEATAKTAKEIIVQGEIITAELIYRFWQEQGLNAVFFNSDSVIRLTGEREPHLEFARVRMDTLQRLYPNQNLFLTQGFLCRNAEDEIDNLERGGSDYSATILGAACRAKTIQIWSDIDGLHNNDPRYVENTQTVLQLSFEEAEELAYFGAKVLHPTCIVPAKQFNIPVLLKNTMQPEAAGTLINNITQTTGIKAIAAKDHITAIKIHSGRMFMAYGFLRRVFDIFEKYRTPVDMITTSEVSVAVTIDSALYLEEITAELQTLGSVELIPQQSIICVVGNFTDEPEKESVRILQALEGIPVRMISFGASSRNLSVLVDSNTKIQALQLLNAHLFNTLQPCLTRA